MDWGYVAGFFDGEGCVYWMTRRGVRRPVLVVGQAESNRAPIDALSAFLTNQSIRHKTYWQDRRPRAQRFLRINIHEHRAIAATVRSMLPHLILKAGKAREALAFIEGRQWQRRPDEEEFRAAHRLYLAGRSSRDVEKATGISARALRSRWKALGLPTRSQQEGAARWRSLRA